MPLLVGCWLAAFLPMLDTSIVNLSLPQLTSAFQLVPSDLGWITNAYLLPLVIVIPVAGRVGDVIGRKGLLALGAFVFAVASLLASLSGSLEMMLLARVLQGIGAGLLMPTSMALVTIRFAPGPKRARALSWYLSGPAFGGALGPVAGAGLTAVGGWPLMFSAQVPIALLVVLLAIAMSVPHTARMRRRLDMVGMMLAALTLLGINVAMLQSPSWGWFSLPALSAWGVAIMAGAMFVRHERSTEDPMIALKVFRSRPFIAAGIAGAAIWFGVISGYMMLPLYLENVRGLEPLHASLLIAAWPLGALMTFPFAGRIVQRMGAGRAMFFSIVVTLAAAVVMRGFGASTEDAVIVLIGIPLGVVTALANVATAAAAVAEFADQDAGVASAVFNTVRQLGSSLGGALPASVLAVVAPAGVSGLQSLDALQIAFGSRIVVLGLALVALLLAFRAGRRLVSPRHAGQY
ncbi:MFS transporter [Bradyrhizobium liaoningense]